MADKKISALTAATTPLVGTEVLPIVQSGSTVKVANNDLRPKQIQSNATSGVLQVAGPAAASTRVMTVPDANFTAARTDAAQSFTGDQTLDTGNLVIGTSGKGVYAGGASQIQGGIICATNSSGGVFTGTQTAASGGVGLDLERTTSNGDICYFRNQGNLAGYITVTGTNCTYNQVSDARLKKNISDAPSASNVIDGLKVRSFDWKANDIHKKYGFIAQELEIIFPDAVSEAADENKTKGVDYTSLVPLLVKEIQELRARVAALETNKE